MAEKKKILYIVEAMGGGVFTYIVKTKVISARVTEVVHELLHQQAEDAGMTLSEFAAQMLMKGRVNTSYVFYVHPDEMDLKKETILDL